MCPKPHPLTGSTEVRTHPLPPPRPSVRKKNEGGRLPPVLRDGHYRQWRRRRQSRRLVPRRAIPTSRRRSTPPPCSPELCPRGPVVRRRTITPTIRPPHPHPHPAPPTPPKTRRPVQRTDVVSKRRRHGRHARHRRPVARAEARERLADGRVRAELRVGRRRVGGGPASGHGGRRSRPGRAAGETATSRRSGRRRDKLCGRCVLRTRRRHRRRRETPTAKWQERARVERENRSWVVNVFS